MAMILNKKDDVNDELTQRINADLRAKMDEASKLDSANPDFAEDAEYVKDFQKTSRFGFLWVILAVGLVVAAIAFAVK